LKFGREIAGNKCYQKHTKAIALKDLVMMLHLYLGAKLDRITICSIWCCHVEEMSLLMVAYKNELIKTPDSSVSSGAI
jgi:hypothetical protein